MLFSDGVFGKNVACNNVKDKSLYLMNWWIWLKIFPGRILNALTGSF